MRIQQKVCLPNVLPTSPLQPDHYEIRYDLLGHSEALRISKTCQVFAGALCPSSETQVAVLTSEGRILFWNVEFQQIGTYSGSSGQAFGINEECSPVLLTPCPVRTVNAVEEWEEEGEEEVWGMLSAGARTLSYSIAPHWFLPPNGKADSDRCHNPNNNYFIPKAASQSMAYSQ